MLWLISWLRQDKGQDLTEYALLIGLLVILSIAAVATLGTAITQVLSNVASSLQSAI